MKKQGRWERSPSFELIDTFPFGRGWEPKYKVVGTGGRHDWRELGIKTALVS